MLNDAKLRGLAVLTGILTIILPFIGSWWELKFAEILVFEISPFEFNIFALGEKIYIPLIYWTTYSFRVIIVSSGVAMVIGGLIDRKWSVHLLRFGAGKIIWFVIGMIITILLVIPINLFLSDIQSQLQNQIQSQMFFKIPVLGEETVSLRDENVRITFKVASELKPPFLLSVALSILGVYLRRKTKPSGSKAEGEAEQIV